MQADFGKIARDVSSEFGFSFDFEEGVHPHGDSWYLLRPMGGPDDHTFAIRTTLTWRRILVKFEPGRFAGDLIAAMGDADPVGRAVFGSVLAECVRRGCSIEFCVNGVRYGASGYDDVWSARWSHLVFTFNIRIDAEVREGEKSMVEFVQWIRLFVAAVLALIPLRQDEPEGSHVVSGFPEGATTMQRSRRYERDRRNRSAAIAIFGCRCQACGLDFGRHYGDAARGFIEVHHTTPVSVLEADTVVDPAKDLVPLCPNCHAVAHRRVPPFSVEEIRKMLAWFHD